MAVMSRRIVGGGSAAMAVIGPAMDSVLAADGVPFVSEGRGGETSHHTAARIDSLPLPVRVACGTLPGAGTVRLRSEERRVGKEGALAGSEGHAVARTGAALHT